MIPMMPTILREQFNKCIKELIQFKLRNLEKIKQYDIQVVNEEILKIYRGVLN